MKKLFFVLALTISGRVLAGVCPSMPAISGCNGFWDNYEDENFKPNMARCGMPQNVSGCPALHECIRERAATGEFCNQGVAPKSGLVPARKVMKKQ